MAPTLRHAFLFLCLLLLLPSFAQQQPFESGGGWHHIHGLRAFDKALRSVRVVRGPFCTEERPRCDDCAYRRPGRPRPNPFKSSRPRPPLTVDLLLSQPSPVQALKLVVRRAFEYLLYAHPIYDRECPAFSAPLWLLPDYLIEPTGRLWADFHELARKLHEGEIRVLDARTIQNACEWAVQQLQEAIDAIFAYLHRRLSGAAAVANYVLVEGLAGGLWGMVAWVGRSIRATVEWTARGIVAGVIWVWTLFTTSVRFALDVALTIARACVDVVIATLREMGQFLKWLTARTARITAEIISGGFEAVIGGMVALGVWIREGIVAVRLSIYTLVLDVLQSIRAFFVDVGRSIWEFVVDTGTAVQQVYLDAVAGSKAAAQGAIASITEGIHAALRTVPIFVLPSEEEVALSLPWTLAFVFACLYFFATWKSRRNERELRRLQAARERQWLERWQQQGPPPPPSAPEQASSSTGTRVYRKARVERTVHVEATRPATQEQVVMEEHEEVTFERAEAEIVAPAVATPPPSPLPEPPRPRHTRQQTLTEEGAAQQQAMPAEEQRPPLGARPSEERESTKTVTRAGTFVIPPPPAPPTLPSPPRRPAAPISPITAQAQPITPLVRPIRSTLLLFVRAALGERDREAELLREVLGPPYWDEMVALYREDFARRGMLTAPRDRPPFRSDGILGADGMVYLLRPPDAGVSAEVYYRLYGHLKGAGEALPGYTFV